MKPIWVASSAHRFLSMAFTCIGWIWGITGAIVFLTPSPIAYGKNLSWLKENVEIRLDGLFSSKLFELEDAPFGREFSVNDVTELSNEEYQLELRPDIKIKAGGFSAQFKPRFESTTFNDDGPLDDETETEFFFNTAVVKYRLGSSYEISLGRQKLLWGNGQFRSPSNPFFPETVLFNPIAEVTGKDFAVFSYRPNFKWEFSAIANWDESHVDEPANPRADFRKSYAVKMEYTGNASHFGTILSKRESKDPRFSSFGNYTFNAATLLYSEFTISKDASGVLPVRDEQGDPIGFERADLVDDEFRHTLLLGGSYTFHSGLTAYVEYINSSEGFNSREAQDWQQLGNNAVSLLGTPRTQEAAPILADAIDPLWRQVRQNYFVLQLSRTEYLNKIDFAMQHVRNLDDGSSSTSVSTTYDITNQAEVFFLLSHNSGGGRKEFGRIINNIAMLGLRIYAF